MAYDPARTRVGEPTPQDNPEAFTDAEIRAEITHLQKLNRRFPTPNGNALRTVAYTRLLQVLADRQTVATP
jgi:hypothetical protein